MVAIPFANELHTVLELSHLGGPVVVVGACLGALLAYVNTAEPERSDAARTWFLGGGVLTLLAVLYLNGTLS